ncbi:hypothetical protein V6Z11_A09G003000 [Gossypium hirsutum]
MVKLHLWVFIILIYLLEFGYGDVIEVAQLKINQKDLMKHLSLVDIKIALPAIYVFGDSFIDNVNNKAVLGNKDAIKGGYLPFGIDFDGKPTGRVTNATVAGLPYPPPIMGMSKIDRKRIRTDFFENTTMEDLKSKFDYCKGFTQYLSKSLFFIHHVGNDLGLTFEVEMAKKYSIDKYAELLIKEFSKQLKRLYTLGEINNRVSFYNNLLPSLLKNLRSTLSGSKFVLGDIYKVFKDVFEMPESYGFKYVKTSCCIDNNGTKIQVCTLNIALCKDRKIRVFFDPFYPSETMDFLWARRFLKDSSVCSPINLIQLMQA